DRRLRASDVFDGAAEKRVVTLRSRDYPDPLFEKLLVILEGFRLDILRKRKNTRARVRWRSQHAHRLLQRERKLVRPVDAIPIPQDLAKRVVNADVLALFPFQLLQDGSNVSPGKNIARQQQHRQPV